MNQNNLIIRQNVTKFYNFISRFINNLREYNTIFIIFIKNIIMIFSVFYILVYSFLDIKDENSADFQEKMQKAWSSPKEEVTELKEELKEFNTELSQNPVLTEDLHRKSLDMVTKAEKLADNTAKELAKLMDKKDKILGDTYETIIKMIDNFKEFISNLNVEQLCLVINLSISIVILTLIINIFTIISGNFLINLLNLEKKWPKLERYIILRRKFQEYYLFLNLIIMTLALLILMYVNYMTLYSTFQ